MSSYVIDLEKVERVVAVGFQETVSTDAVDLVKVSGVVFGMVAVVVVVVVVAVVVLVVVGYCCCCCCSSCSCCCWLLLLLQ